MANFDYYTQFVLRGNESDSSLRHNFFSVTKKEINEAEDALGFNLPLALVEFYEKIGYGFMFTDEENSLNMLLDPITIADIYLRRDQFEGDPDLDIYDDKSKIIFFQVNEGVFITIDKAEGKSRIYYFRVKVADSFEEFLIKLEQDSSYFEKFEIVE